METSDQVTLNHRVADIENIICKRHCPCAHMHSYVHEEETIGLVHALGTGS